MQLHGVIPNNTLDGFDVTIIKRNETLVQNQESETLLIDYYYELCVICTGDNPAYSEEGYAIFLISQLTDTCSIEVVPPDDKTEVVILKVTQILKGIWITEGAYEGKRYALLCMKVYEEKQQKCHTLTWLLRKRNECKMH